ncbi:MULTISPECIES: PRC-barrel domain-containing protein [unclassified Streptomyces]|uniref:PRC-barrel domain-containing protein n=1 Tax=unclassified Streptomyces TaxID=2593676 RepID=UPI002E2A25D1|nr:PRC-barrel domain-containing protein [Streptomyces sp. NBC_00223]
MIQPADLREWRDHDVVDAEDHKIGVLEAVYVDTVTDLPSVVTVRTGLPTRHRLVFVPVGDVTAGPGYVRVPYTKALVRSAPSIGTDDVLPVEDEEAIFRHYGLPYKPGPDGARQLARR